MSVPPFLLFFYIRSSEMGVFISSTTDPTYLSSSVVCLPLPISPVDAHPGGVWSVHPSVLRAQNE